MVVAMNTQNIWARGCVQCLITPFFGVAGVLAAVAAFYRCRFERFLVLFIGEFLRFEAPLHAARAGSKALVRVAS